MSSELYKQVKQRKDELAAEFQNYAPDMQDIADLMRPTRGGFITQKPPGSRLTDRMYDSTAPMSLDLLGATLAGNIMSRSYIWATLSFHDEKMQRDNAAKRALDLATARLMRHFNMSAAYTEVAQCLTDAPGFGNAVLLDEELPTVGGRFGGCNHRSQPLSATRFSEGEDGEVDTVYRTMEKPLREMMGPGWNLGREARAEIARGEINRKITVTHAVFPRTRIRNGGLETSATMPWASVWIDDRDTEVIRVSGYREFPFIVLRWQRCPGETVGRGQGHLLLPHVRILNEKCRVGLSMDRKHDDPAMTAKGTWKNKLSVDPGWVNYGEDDAELTPTIPMGVGTEAYGLREKSVEDLRAIVERGFYAHQLQMPIGPTMTAFEFSKRMEMLQRVLGPKAAPIEQFLEALIKIDFTRMQRRGEFPELMAVLGKRQAPLAIDFQGPLAKNQRLSTAEGLEKVWLRSGELAVGGRPDVWDNHDLDRQMRDYADILGLPADYWKDPDDVQAARDQRAQAEQEQQHQDTAQRTLEAAGRGAPALKLLGGAGG